MPSRGCVICVSSGSGQGAYGIEGLNSSGCPPIIIESVSPSDRDIVQPVTTLANKKIVYVFGEAIGDIQISGTAYLGKNADGAAMDRVIAFMKAHRLSGGSTSPVNVAVPGGAYKVWITGMGIGSPNAEFCTQGFMLTGLIADPP